MSALLRNCLHTPVSWLLPGNTTLKSRDPSWQSNTLPAIQVVTPCSSSVRSRTDFFFRPSSRFLPQVLQAQAPLHQFPDVRAAVLLDSEPGEFLYVTSTYAGQPISELNETQPFEFRVYDHAYPLQTSSTARSRLVVNRPTGYRSLTGTNSVCGETITSTLHIIARAEGWGLQAMPPQPLQPVWLGNSSFWS